MSENLYTESWYSWYDKAADICAAAVVYASAVVLQQEQMLIITSINNFFQYYSSEVQLKKFSQKLSSLKILILKGE